MHRAGPRPLVAIQRAAVRRNNAGHESLSSPRQRYVMAINDCKQSARRNERRAKFFIPKVRGYVQISAAVRRANADPAVAHLMIVHARIVDRRGQVHHLRRQASHRVQDRIGRNHAIVLRGDERDARVDQRLLRIQDVERRPLSGLGFLAHAVQRDFRRLHLCLGGRDLRLAGNQLPPCRDDVGAGLIPRLFENEALLRQRFLGLTDQRLFAATLIDRHLKLRSRRRAERPV